MTVRTHAAAGYTGGVLSHWSALYLHGVIDEGVTRLDVTVPRHRRVRSSRWLRVHHSTRPIDAVPIRGLPVSRLPRALVDTWGLAHRATAMRGADAVARHTVLRAARQRVVTVGAIEAELPGHPQLPARARLIELLGFVSAGCQSELEICGLRDVVTVPGLPAPVLQHRVDLPGGRVYLDAAWPELKIAVEWDAGRLPRHARSQGARFTPGRRPRRPRLGRAPVRLPRRHRAAARVPCPDRRRPPAARRHGPPAGHSGAWNARVRDLAPGDRLISP